MKRGKGRREGGRERERETHPGQQDEMNHGVGVPNSTSEGTELCV
jgi:hypothetical protein